MKTTFVEYVNKKENINKLLESIVAEAQNNQELFQILDEAGFWNNLKQAGGQLWQGLKSGVQGAYSQMTGPATQVGNAIASLEKVIPQLQKDPNWSKSTTTGASGKFPAMNLIDWLQATIQELKSQQPQFSNKQVAGVQTQTAQPADPSIPVSPGGTSKGM